MATSKHSSTPFEKFFADASNNPLAKMFKELNAPLCSSWKESAEQYLHTSEEWGQKALEWNKQATAWAKETPLAPVFETQRNIAAQLLDNSVALARRFWQLDAPPEEKAA